MMRKGRMLEFALYLDHADIIRYVTCMGINETDLIVTCDELRQVRGQLYFKPQIKASAC